MNRVGSDTVVWHLEQAALHELRAQRHIRRGFFFAADDNRRKAEAHREKAARLEKKDAA